MHEAVSAPTLTKRITDSTPVTLGEFDRFALNRKRTVKDFAVRAIVGKGNYGVVFMVTEAGTDRCLAIKVRWERDGFVACIHDNTSA